MSYGNVLAVIPCRRGSKRFPGKNTAFFDGMPLVQNTIRIAKAAGIEKILVTTDDPLVIAIAVSEGVKYLNRPEDLCTDDARMEGVVENAVHYAMSATDGPHWEFDTICLMQVTSPMLHPLNLQIALDKYFEVISKSLTAINSSHKPCGAFYIVDRELFMSNKSLYHTGGGVYMLPEHQCIDVDHHYDLLIANAVESGRIV
jgi:CMP-N-acetylneuraminic acid synthetase